MPPSPGTASSGPDDVTQEARSLRDLTTPELEGSAVRRLMHLACGYDGDRLTAVIRDELPGLETVGVVVDGSGEPVAMAAVRRPEADGPAVLEYLATLEDRQGEGLATALVAAVRRRHPGHGLVAETDDDAVGFYRALRFTVGPGPVDPRWPTTTRYRCELPPLSARGTADA